MTYKVMDALELITSTKERRDIMNKLMVTSVMETDNQIRDFFIKCYHSEQLTIERLQTRAMVLLSYAFIRLEILLSKEHYEEAAIIRDFIDQINQLYSQILISLFPLEMSRTDLAFIKMESLDFKDGLHKNLKIEE